MIVVWSHSWESAVDPCTLKRTARVFKLANIRMTPDKAYSPYHNSSLDIQLPLAYALSMSL